MSEERFSHITPLPGKILIHNMQRGARNLGGILLLNDDGKDHGVRPRWAQVYAVGEGVTFVKPGEWILLEHGRWTRQMKVLLEDGPEDGTMLWAADPEAVMMKSIEEPTDETVIG